MLAWLAHLYTASGSVMGFLAAVNVVDSDYRAAFTWLFAAVFVDATDGMLARFAGVTVRLPWFNGELLDNIVDYVTYVFVPALLVWHALLVPDTWAVPVCAAMLLSSAYGFSRDDAKTNDHFFTGFPSYWNIAVFYLFLGRWPPIVNAAVLIVLSVLVFVPVRYIYPSRTPTLRTFTMTLGAAWAGAMFVLLRQAPDVSRTLFWASFAFPVYYTLVSLALHLKVHRAGSVRR